MRNDCGMTAGHLQDGAGRLQDDDEGCGTGAGRVQDGVGRVRDGYGMDAG
jgi:hypothetical protein